MIVQKVNHLKSDTQKNEKSKNYSQMIAIWIYLKLQ
jgi:hypothetical protein